MSRVKEHWGLGLVIVLLVLIYVQLPLGTAFAFSTDEGFEVIKPFMCNHGYVLYRDIWNDQPPVFTVLIAAIFRTFGTTMLNARLTTVCYAIIFFTVFHELIRRRSGQRCALLACFLLLCSPGVLLLSSSAMLELPAMTTGWLAGLLLFQWARRPHWIWLVTSGAVMALAAQTKFTSLLLVPAIFVEFVLLTEAKLGRKHWFKKAANSALIWSAGFAVVFALIGLTWAKGSLEMALKSHTGDNVVPGLDRVEDHQFNFQLLHNHIECAVAAVVAVGLAFYRKRGREIVFPLTLLLTDALVHAVHHPWWDYYYLHLAVPLAWLAGWGVNEVIRIILELYGKRRFNLFTTAAWEQIGMCILVGLVLTRSELRLEGTVKNLKQSPKADDNSIVKEMRKYAGSVHLVYSESGIYPFYANLSVAPELTVMPLKRFWSGQISTDDIIEICRRDKIKLVVLPKERINTEWKDFLDTEYFRVSSDEQSDMFAAKQIEHP